MTLKFNSCWIQQFHNKIKIRIIQISYRTFRKDIRVFIKNWNHKFWWVPNRFHPIKDFRQTIIKINWHLLKMQLVKFLFVRKELRNKVFKKEMKCFRNKNHKSTAPALKKMNLKKCTQILKVWKTKCQYKKIIKILISNITQKTSYKVWKATW